MKKEKALLGIFALVVIAIAYQRNTSNDKGNVRKVLDNWLDTLENGTAKEVADLYTEDAVLLGTVSEKLDIGRQQIEGYFDGFLESNPSGLITQLDVQNMGMNIAVANGLYTFNLSPEDASTEEVQARFTYVLERKLTSNTWLIKTHHSSKNPSELRGKEEGKQEPKKPVKTRRRERVIG
tara:strand:- start:74 stop:613 length:540 start_codon:yes stop_codon:yes gene_type:complete